MRYNYSSRQIIINIYFMENPTLEQEIAQLQQQIEEKKRTLAQGSPEATPSDKEILHEVIGEKIQENAPEYQSKPSQTIQSSSAATDDHHQSYLKPEFREIIQRLVNTVFGTSLDTGIKEASATKNMALIDAFHDVLVDELYGALVERKKISEVK